MKIKPLLPSLLSACCRYWGDPSDGPDSASSSSAASSLRPSVTYITLLEKSPFFRRLSRKQLEWVVEHSEEWYARKGIEVTSPSSGSGTLWVLLDGAWRVEYERLHYHVVPSEPGNWFGGPWMPACKGTARVVATELSYVLSISVEDLGEMTAQGFDFHDHQRAGVEFYQEILTR